MQNAGIAFLPRAAVLEDMERNRLVSLNLDGLRVEVSVYLVTDPQRVPTPAVRAFLSFVG